MPDNRAAVGDVERLDTVLPASVFVMPDLAMTLDCGYCLPLCPPPPNFSFAPAASAAHYPVGTSNANIPFCVDPEISFGGVHRTTTDFLPSTVPRRRNPDCEQPPNGRMAETRVTNPYPALLSAPCAVPGAVS